METFKLEKSLVALLILLLIVVSASKAQTNFWVQKNDLGYDTINISEPTSRSMSVGFNIGNKGYLGTGYDNSTCKRDFWEYDPDADTWTQKADFGGTIRRSAVGFSIDSKGYLGTGECYGDSTLSFYKDFWEYDPELNIWTQKADFGGVARSYAVGFSIGSKGYVGTGYNYDNPHYHKDFWEYDPALDTWTQKADFGGTVRDNAVGFSIGDKGYLGTGHSYDLGDIYYKDFWEYDQSSNMWTQKADFGGTARSKAVGFNIGNKGYAGTGLDGNYKKDFWEYDPDANTWTQKADFGGTARLSAVGFSIGNKGYLGTGYDDNGAHQKDFREYDQESNTWTQKADFGGTARSGAVGFSIGSKGYLATGDNDGTIHKYFWEYDPELNTWMQKADFGGTARSWAVGFSIGSKGYIGTGSAIDGLKQDFWEYDPELNIWTQKADFGGGARRRAAGFSIGTKGYLGTGDDDFFYRKDFWQYDPESNTWTQKADFGGTARWGAVGFSIGSKGYLGTGRSTSGGDNKDFWEYDPVANTWTQKTDFGGTGRTNAVGFSIGNKGYLGTGLSSTDLKKNFYQYDQETNSWSPKAEFGGTARSNAVGFSIGNKGYLGTGEDGFGYKKDFWEYTPKCYGWTYYADEDGDGYGDTSNSFFAEDCIAPNGYVVDSFDCDDTNPSVHPASTEICNNVDDNCNGSVDDGLLFVTYYADNDADTFGDANNSASSCEPVSGYVENNADCDDNNSSVNPSATEICNNLDDNCNGSVDDGLIFVTYYADNDGDTFGDANNSASSCEPVSGYVENNTDCDDNNSSVNPSATEICNNLDDNCNGSVDDGLVFTTYYADNDADSFGDVNNSASSCEPVSGYVENNTDCDDNNSSINPSATEICNNLDDNCNGSVDDGLVFTTYYADADGDNYGDATNSVSDCEPVEGYILDNTDCDDSNAGVNPGVLEISNNGIDDNCNGDIDEFGVGISSVGNDAPSLSVFPNPADGAFMIELKLSDAIVNEATVEVINQLGQIVHEEKALITRGLLQKEIQLSDEADGIYLVKVIVANRVYSAQIDYKKK